jgi:hypothetical protein
VSKQKRNKAENKVNRKRNLIEKAFELSLNEGGEARAVGGHHLGVHSTEMSEFHCQLVLRKRERENTKEEKRKHTRKSGEEQ